MLGTRPRVHMGTLRASASSLHSRPSPLTGRIAGETGSCVIPLSPSEDLAPHLESNPQPLPWPEDPAPAPSAHPPQHNTSLFKVPFARNAPHQMSGGPDAPCVLPPKTDGAPLPPPAYPRCLPTSCRLELQPPCLTGLLPGFQS